MRRALLVFMVAAVILVLLQRVPRVHSQPPQGNFPDQPGRDISGPSLGERSPAEGDFRPRGRGMGSGGPGGPGGPFREERKVVAKFDADKNGWLNAEERATARKEMPAEPERRGPGGFGGRGLRGARPGGPEGGGAGPGGPGPGFGRRDNLAPAKPGQHVAPADVPTYPDADLYDSSVLRTLFLEFENADWEKELSDFHNTDVEVPARLTVDGKQYPNVGVHFRGMSSYMGVPAGYKRSLNLSIDFIDQNQRLYGYRTLNLLNSHEDSSFMSSVLYSHIARQYLPAPKANFVRVVINGEDWGVYANVQQFNKDFVKENYGTDLGNRWKVRGNPGADGGLRYLGEDVEPYKQRFTLKSKSEDKAWHDLITLCRTLEQTPPEKLEAALEPILDIDGTLKFLALDVALVNNDGYWVRSSDYSLYEDPNGKFHLIPNDMNESFRVGGPPGGPGMRGRRGGRFGRDPGRDDERRPGDGRAAGDRTRREQAQDDTGGGRDESRSRNDGRPPEADQFGFGPPPEGPDFGPPPGGPDFGPPEFRPPGFGPPNFGPPDFGPGGAGRPRGPGGGGVELDPLVGLENDRTPLRSKLLAVPALRARYLAYVRQMAENSLDWKNLGPVVGNYRDLIAEAVKRDTRKLSTFEAFERATADEPSDTDSTPREMSLRTFADRRRAFLLEKTKPASPETKEVADKP